MKPKSKGKIIPRQHFAQLECPEIVIVGVLVSTTLGRLNNGEQRAILGRIESRKDRERGLIFHRGNLHRGRQNTTPKS